MTRGHSQEEKRRVGGVGGWKECECVHVCVRVGHAFVRGRWMAL